MIKTRFAPSPTGWLHIGGVRTALFSWLFAKSQSGQFYIRIDDTDTSRSTKEYCDSIISALHSLGLDSDRELMYQSKRFDVYIDKDPSDTISIKYSNTDDIKKTIKKLERLYKTKKYKKIKIITRKI